MASVLAEVEPGSSPQPAPVVVHEFGHRARWTTWSPYVLFGCAGPLAALLLFSASGRDDSHITYWAAKALAETGEIVNYNGDRIEQSSSLLHVLLVAAVSRLTTLPVPTVGFAVGLVAAGATAVLAYRLGADRSPAAGWLAGALVATTAYLSYWSVGGLETSVAALLLLGALGASGRFVDAGSSALRRRWFLRGMPVVVLCVLVRPESGLVLLAALALAAGTMALLARRLQAVVPFAVLGSVAALAYAGVGLFRLWYFGSFVPNTVSAKVAGLQLGAGWAYVRSSLGRPGLLLLLALAVVGAWVALRRRSAPGVLLAAGVVAQFAFVLSTGGDWMEAGRMLVPALPLMAVLAAAAVAHVGSRTLLAGVTVAAVVLTAQVVDTGMVARNVSTGAPAWSTISWAEAPAEVPGWAGWFERRSRLRMRDTIFVERLISVVDQLRPAIGRPVVVASGQAGVAPYHLLSRRGDDVRFIDRWSLATDDFDHCPGGHFSTVYGTGISYGYWFDHLRECRLPMPDVIFDRRSFESRPSIHADYAPVYAIAGEVESGSQLLPGARVMAPQVLAVRKDLLPALVPPPGG